MPEPLNRGGPLAWWLLYLPSLGAACFAALLFGLVIGYQIALALP